MNETTITADRLIARLTGCISDIASSESQEDRMWEDTDVLVDILGDLIYFKCNRFQTIEDVQTAVELCTAIKRKYKDTALFNAVNHITSQIEGA